MITLRIDQRLLMEASASWRGAIQGFASCPPEGWSIELVGEGALSGEPVPVTTLALCGSTLYLVHGTNRVDGTAIDLQGPTQLESLGSLPRYPGMCSLLAGSGDAPQDYRQRILRRHAASLAKLAQERKAAVFGAQRLGRDAARALKRSGVMVLAFIDNDARKWGSRVEGVEVCSLESVHDHELPIVIGTTKFTHSIGQQLRQAGFTAGLPYSVMSLYDERSFPAEIPYCGLQEDFSRSAFRYLGLFLDLADDKSRRVLDALLSYRLTYDPSPLQAVADPAEQHYFDDGLIRLSHAEVFVDAGGYDGDTVQRFIEAARGRYKKAYLFEPDTDLLERARRRLTGRDNIVYVNAGVYSEDGHMSFATTASTAGALSAAGNVVVPVRSLDTSVAEAPTFIKMDIEGAEKQALAGARRHIAVHKPRLAVAAYHRGEDVWEIAALVKALNPAYRLFLRHYSETGLETVLYAL